MVRTSSNGSSQSRVTFELPAVVQATTVHLCGDFNDWSESATPLEARPDGRFAVTITLDHGRQYRFRYLVDGTRWENDWHADDYVRNEFGGDDSVVDLTGRRAGNGR
ncbi:MAG TPA: isoamylase early set domain-containing protein [Aquihabitans sp.]|jgi:1,4-alpha-glucan branching enzyme|nr:isoamylase early set domain-containing protein [Aquihabitans sp.]